MAIVFIDALHLCQSNRGLSVIKALVHQSDYFQNVLLSIC
ncbi:Carboxylesterase family protein [Aspergillus niger]|uniref:Carboxylesterase family protein n=1 Tax=Aspergillus niger TaxID=5061 RepID=A0A505HQJ7_ASPNG|nr:Carboxylesterase family protein [Aspergillus niger]